MIAADREFRDAITTRLQRGLAAGELGASVDPHGLATVVVGMLRGVALQSLLDDHVDLQSGRPEIEQLLTNRLRKEAGREGMQHLAYWTTDFQALYDRAISLGYRVMQEGSIGGEQGRFAYLDTEHEPGTVIEISDVSGPKDQFFSYIRDVAKDWDGTDPIRRQL